MLPLAAEAAADEIAEATAGARVVMLGEATHGTTEFYGWRRVVSQRLIERHGFRFIAVEGDWPDCHKIDEYACGREAGGSDDPITVLASFDRWPTWMWANEQVWRLMTWMREFNASRPAHDQVRFHGLDVYSLYKSIDAVLGYLESVDPVLYQAAADRYECFGPYDRDEIGYARATLRLPRGCGEEAVAMLVELLARQSDTAAGGSELFDAQQNARVVRNAEHYYSTMLHGDVNSWNIRDRHMIETLDALLRSGGSADGAQPRRGIVWAHNTHIGDYRATDMDAAGYVNLGGLARESYGPENVSLVGFGTYQGTVTAGRAWDAPAQRMPVPPARLGSYEDAFERSRAWSGVDDFALIFDSDARSGPLAEVAGHRAIGVVYNPEHESRGNYVPTSLAERYDVFVHVRDTTALVPLPTALDTHEIPETWPSGV